MNRGSPSASTSTQPGRQSALRTAFGHGHARVGRYLHQRRSRLTTVRIAAASAPRALAKRTAWRPGRMERDRRPPRTPRQRGATAARAERRQREAWDWAREPGGARSNDSNYRLGSADGNRHRSPWILHVNYELGSLTEGWLALQTRPSRRYGSVALGRQLASGATREPHWILSHDSRRWWMLHRLAASTDGWSAAGLKAALPSLHAGRRARPLRAGCLGAPASWRSGSARRWSRPSTVRTRVPPSSSTPRSGGVATGDCSTMVDAVAGRGAVDG